MKRLSFIIVLSFLLPFTVAIGQSINHWETVVFNNDTWRYFVGTTEPQSDWRSKSFNEAFWPSGTGGFGYGDGDDNTVIPQSRSVFFRIKFTVADTSLIVRAILSMDYDDAFVAYLNDTEIARVGITGTNPAFDQFGSDHEAKMYSGGDPESFVIDKPKLKSCLLPGENILAIQVHNSSTTSSDLSSNAFLSFGIANSSVFFRPVPSWFSSQITVFSTNLPLL